MAWWRGDDRAFANSKLLAVGLDGIGLHWQAVSWAAGHESDGLVPTHVLPVLAPGLSAAKLRVLVERLTSTAPGEDRPLWEPCETGYVIVGYLDYNPSASELCERRKLRAEAGALGGQQRARNRQANA